MYIVRKFVFLHTLLAEGELEMSSVSWQFLFLEMKCEVVKFFKSFSQLAQDVLGKTISPEMLGLS